MTQLVDEQTVDTLRRDIKTLQKQVAELTARIVTLEAKD